MIFSLREETVIDWLYLLGPISVPSASLNLSSIQSSPAISFQFAPEKKQKSLKEKNSKFLETEENHRTGLFTKTQITKPKTGKQQKPKSILVENFKSPLLKSTKPTRQQGNQNKKSIFFFFFWTISTLVTRINRSDEEQIQIINWRNFDKEMKF